MFNDEQRGYMRYLASMPATERCYSGWCSLTRSDSSSRDYCSGSKCPTDVTLADRERWACECCGNYPDPVTGRFTHNVTCSPARRREHYAGFDLGGEG